MTFAPAEYRLKDSLHLRVDVKDLRPDVDCGRRDQLAAADVVEVVAAVQLVAAHVVYMANGATAIVAKCPEDSLLPEEDIAPEVGDIGESFGAE